MISWKEKFEDLLSLIFKKYIYNSEQNTMLVIKTISIEFKYMTVYFYHSNILLPIILVSVALGSDEFQHRSPIHVLRNIHTSHIQNSWGQVHIHHKIRNSEAIQRKCKSCMTTTHSRVLNLKWAHSLFYCNLFSLNWNLNQRWALLIASAYVLWPRLNARTTKV